MTAQVITECIRGHIFTPENTRYNKDGHRWCRACNRLQVQKRRGRRTISAVPYPDDPALRVQQAFNAWCDAYSNYSEGRLKNTRLRRQHLTRINQLFAEYQKLESRYQQKVLAA